MNTPFPEAHPVGSELDAFPTPDQDNHSAESSTSADPEPGDADLTASWQAFGFETNTIDGVFNTILPASTIGLRAQDSTGNDRLTNLLKRTGLPPHLVIKTSPFFCSVYRVENEAIIDRIDEVFSEGVTLYRPRGSISIPRVLAGEMCQTPGFDVSSLLTEESLTAMSAEPEALPSLDPVSRSNPLIPYSLRGKAAAFEEKAKATKPLLGDICMSGQATVWYAPPNAGKTLIALNLTLQAVQDRRIAAGNVFYVNADDNSSGLATKLRMMDDLGAHTLVPGFKDFKATDLIDVLNRAAATDEANGVLVIIDTAKKFTNLMDKNHASTFANACRQFVMRGGSILALAHTTKNPNSDGKLRYGGTTDFIEDMDAVYMLRPLDLQAEEGEKVVQFELVKRRADSPETAAFAYAAESGISYEERLASVRPVDLAQLDEFKRIVEEKSDTEVIDAIAACIASGINTKMVLAKAASLRTGVSERAAIRMIEKYTGTDPDKHKWAFAVKARGAKLYEVLPVPAD